jgi:hypothetical protein
MADESRETTPGDKASLRTRTAGGSSPAGVKRFEVFLIDTGWNKPVSKSVRSYLTTLAGYQKLDSLYVLSEGQSVEVLRRDSGLIGRDPILLFYDLHAPVGRDTGTYRGFRLHMGRYRNGEQALSRLQEFLRFVSAHRTAERLDRAVLRELHREGFSGAVKILREASAASVELL